MRKIKLIIQMLVAFIIATFAYNLFYEPHQDTVRSTVQEQLSKVSAQEGSGSAKGSSNVGAMPEGKLRITMLDVGQGDAILLEDDKRKVMIDVGDNKKDKLGYGGRTALKMALGKAGVRENVDRINTVIITHHHGDHLGNMQWLAGKYKVSNIYDNAMPNEKNAVSNWLNKELRAGHYHNRVLKAGDRVDFGKGYYLDVLAPGDFLSKEDLKRFNNTSIVMMLHYGKFTMLFTGDAEAPVEDYLQQKYGSQLKADVLKVGHHGSKSSSIYKFISKVKPKYALISCGNKQIYNHPNKNVVGSLEHLGAKVLTTYDHGNLTVTTDGKGFEVTTER
ncbi:MAG: MBL fold metallo-hydrolase [Phascolarctobacterium sp.]|nr:MBL fold metallo-hydrolase [Phascolarctobacterium sp.]